MSSVVRSTREIRSQVFYSGTAGMCLMAVALVALPFASKSVVIYFFESPNASIVGELIKVFYVSWAITLFAIFTMIYRRNIETSLIRIQHLAEVGQITTQVIHDLKSPIGALQMTLSTLQRSETPEIKVEHWMPILEASCERLNGITNDLLGTYGGKQETSQSFELHEVLNNCMIEIKQAYALRDIEWVARFHETGIILNGKRNQLGRVFLNLIKNAAEAMSTSGTIMVSTALLPDFINVEIKDTGTGMTKVQIESFLAGKLISNKLSGSGIGSNFVKNSLEEHGAALAIQSDSAGTCFTL
jgi:two-component system nitrogen regulation sensor histidine kinase GlnL